MAVITRENLKLFLAQLKRDFYRLVFIICSFFLLYFIVDSTLNSKIRAELNHGIDFPKNTEIHHCTGTLPAINIEGHNTSTGIFPRTELEGFLTQFTVINQSEDTVAGIAYRKLYCAPFVGDNLIVAYSISESDTCHFRIDSDWN